MTALMASNLWRNHFTPRAVLIVVIFVTLISGALLLCQGAADASGAPKSGNEVTVWMAPDANTHEIRVVRARLARLSYVRQPCVYWNKARNFAEARKLLPVDIWKSASAAEMPTSYWCTPMTLADANQVISTMKGSPGVLTVTIDPTRTGRE
jgi:cell division protein FtsX